MSNSKDPELTKSGNATPTEHPTEGGRIPCCLTAHLPAPVEIVECRLGASPIFANLHEEFEKDFGSYQAFNLFSGGGADAFEHRSTFADEDGFLSFAFAVDG